MKRQLLSILLLVSGTATGLKAQQLSADAGIDTVICPSVNTMPHIGSDNPAAGGTPPYSYKWVSSGKNTASYYLSDTKSPHPELKRLDQDSIIFTLEVTDALNDKVSDEVKVYQTKFTYLMADCRSEKAAKDTVYLDGAGVNSNFPPLTYEWSPAEYIKDVKAASPIVWAPFTKTYTAKVTDRLGCVTGGQCYVYVYPAGIDDIHANNNIVIYPNPLTQESMINIDEEMIGGVLKVYAADGRELINEKLNTDKVAIGNKLHASSIYFYTVEKEGKTMALGKLICND